MAKTTSRWADPGLLVLGSLAEGEKHGYAIADDIAASTGRRPGPGTLYGAIARLERDGLIQALEGEERRRPYRLSAEGRSVLAAELDGMRAFTRSGLSRLQRSAASA